MTATLAQYREYFTEHASISDADVTRALTDTALFVSSNQFPADELDLAQLYFAAHCVQLDYVNTPGNASAAVASRTVGKVSVSFAQANTADSDLWLETTSYGQRFKYIRDACIVGVSFF